MGKNQFSCCPPVAMQETGLLVIYLPTASLQMTPTQAQLNWKSHMYHMLLILCQVVKTEVLLLPESAHHRGKIILSLKCQHFIKNKLNQPLGQNILNREKPGTLGLPPQIQPAVGRKSVLAFSSPWGHREVSELVLFLSHTFLLPLLKWQKCSHFILWQRVWFLIPLLLLPHYT